MHTPRIYTTQAIVLKRKNFGEADKLFTLFSKEYGKFVVIGKGVRKVVSRRASHLEVFTYVSLLLCKGKTWDVVSDAQAIERYNTLREKLESINNAYYVCELVDQLIPEHQEYPQIFELLRSTLTHINNQNHPNTDEIMNVFAHTLLSELGFLAKGKSFTSAELDPYIESIVERKLRTPRVFRQLA